MERQDGDGLEQQMLNYRGWKKLLDEHFSEKNPGGDERFNVLLAFVEAAAAKKDKAWLDIALVEIKKLPDPSGIRMARVYQTVSRYDKEVYFSYAKILTQLVVNGSEEGILLMIDSIPIFPNQFLKMALNVFEGLDDEKKRRFFPDLFSVLVKLNDISRLKRFSENFLDRGDNTLKNVKLVIEEWLKADLSGSKEYWLIFNFCMARFNFSGADLEALFSIYRPNSKANLEALVSIYELNVDAFAKSDPRRMTSLWVKFKDVFLEIDENIKGEIKNILEIDENIDGENQPGMSFTDNGFRKITNVLFSAGQDEDLCNLLNEVNSENDRFLTAGRCKTLIFDLLNLTLESGEDKKFFAVLAVLFQAVRANQKKDFALNLAYDKHLNHLVQCFGRFFGSRKLNKLASLFSDNGFGGEAACIVRISDKIIDPEMRFNGAVSIGRQGGDVEDDEFWEKIPNISSVSKFLEQLTEWDANTIMCNWDYLSNIFQDLLHNLLLVGYSFEEDANFEKNFDREFAALRYICEPFGRDLLRMMFEISEEPRSLIYTAILAARLGFVELAEEIYENIGQNFFQMGKKEEEFWRELLIGRIRNWRNGVEFL